jgi:hypothetical protein
MYVFKGFVQIQSHEWTALANRDSTSFLKEKLDNLGKRRGQIQESLTALEIEIGEVERDRVDQDLVTKALADFSAVFSELKPYQQKELIRLVLHKAILSPDCLKLGLYGRPPEVRALIEGDSRFQTFKWLPGQMSESVVLLNTASARA